MCIIAKIAQKHIYFSIYKKDKKCDLYFLKINNYVFSLLIKHLLYIYNLSHKLFKVKDL